MASTDFEVILDDAFVLKSLNDFALKVRGACDPSTIARDWNNQIKKCVVTLRKHYCLTEKNLPTRGFIKDQEFLTKGLTILGHKLGLYNSIGLIQQTIETDWLAHTELEKKKRYRDHITHPHRVTAIGGWFLHRKNKTLLDKLSKYYKRRTKKYCEDHRIDINKLSWEEIVSYAWLATGLLHDCAFLLEYRLRSGHRLNQESLEKFGIFPKGPRSLSEPQRIRKLTSFFEKTWIAEQSLDLEARIRQMSADKFEHSHALLGGLHHCLALDEKLHSLQGLIIQLAARAIITHHDKDHRQILSDPLAVLLCVSDGLQSWKRPFFHREPGGGKNDERIIRPIFECLKVSLKSEGDGYVAIHEMDPDKKNQKILKDIYEWELDKFCEPNKKLEQLIKKSKMFPRIACSEKRCICPENFCE